MPEKLKDPRSIRAEEKVQKAFEDMIKLGLPVSFTSVAARAGVSRQYLYKNEKFSETIRSVRDKLPENKTEEQELSENARLRLEILSLKKEIESLHDQIEKPHLYIGKANKLEKENAELKASNKRLQEKVANLEKQLETAYKL